MRRLSGSRITQSLAILSVFLTMAALIVGMVGCGPSSQELEIRTWYDLDAVRDNLDGSYVLMNDLDSTTPGYEELAGPAANEGKGWQPIGGIDSHFTGTFDGQGHEIHDLFINRPDEDNVGLFGYVTTGVIKYVGIANATVIGKYFVGGLVGRNGRYVGPGGGTISESYSTGSVTGMSLVGGLMGYNGGTVSGSHSTAGATATDGVGGLVGLNRGTVNDSHSSGSVAAVTRNGITGGSWAGGLVGQNDLMGSVSNSYSTGSVTGNAAADIGGLVGMNGATVVNCYSTGSVTGYYDVGGLVGNNPGAISNSYSTGNVTGVGVVGGLVGWNHEGTVSNSYYNYEEVLINGEQEVTIGALFSEDFQQWLANNKSLDINERLTQANGYYLIDDVNDLRNLLVFGQYGALKFKLTNNLDLASDPNFYIPYLAGEFDGNGHKISNLSFHSDSISCVGLFGFLASGGKVTQLGVENASIMGFSHVGGLVGESMGIVSNSYSTGGVTCITDYCGGLVGYDEGTVSNSYSAVNAIGYAQVGGLVGWTLPPGTVSNSYSIGSVIGDGPLGGLIGENYQCIVSNSFWDTETSGQASSDGGTGKNTTEMQYIVTFSGAGWNITAVALNETNPAYIWNIVNNVTYPFLSWQAVQTSILEVEHEDDI